MATKAAATALLQALQYQVVASLCLENELVILDANFKIFSRRKTCSQHYLFYKTAPCMQATAALPAWCAYLASVQSTVTSLVCHHRCG